MGSRNAAAVFTYWPDLDDRAKLLALHIALLTLDEPRGGLPAGLYFGGRHAMAEALYGPLPSDDATDTYSVLRLDVAYRGVRRVLARLVDEGVLKLARRQAPGRAREWQLSLPAG